MRWGKSLVLFVLRVTIVPAKAGFKEAIEAYDRGDYGGAGKEFRELPEPGDLKAQVNLGVTFSKSQGVAQNELEAANWYRQAADQGNAAAQFYLGLRCENGLGIAKNDSEAALCYYKAAN